MVYVCVCVCVCVCVRRVAPVVSALLVVRSSINLTKLETYWHLEWVSMSGEYDCHGNTNLLVLAALSMFIVCCRVQCTYLEEGEQC